MEISDRIPAKTAVNRLNSELNDKILHTNYHSDVKVLAYFWLHAYYDFDHVNRAKAYFTAMERRGINADNPFRGFYGKSNHEPLI